MKKVLILGGGGFIGGHLGRKMKNQNIYIRIADIKKHEHFNHYEICDDFYLGDLKELIFVKKVFDVEGGFDEVYQLAADMGGSGYIFTGENDANVMYNSAMINLNVINECVLTKVRKVFYSSSACIYPEHNQLDPKNPNCEESSAYPANPDSEYGWEKLFSERLFLSFNRNYGIDVRIARFHNIFGPYGTWNGGKEKAPAAICRKVLESNGEIEIWGDGSQTRSFLYIDECLIAVENLMNSDFTGPVNIGSEEMVSINELVNIVSKIGKKKLVINNIYGNKFSKKYGHKCPIGVMGRKSDNKLFFEKTGYKINYPLELGLSKTYQWISEQVKSNQL